jgi:hypothetical protein
MAIINCPKCQGKLKFPDDSPPRRVKCPACGTAFVAGPQGPVDDAADKSSERSASTPAIKEEVAKDFEVVDDKSARSKSRDDESKSRNDDDDRDRKKRRDDDEEEERIRKKRRDDEDDDRDRKKRRDDDDEDDRDRKKRRDDDRDRKKRRDDDDEDDRDRKKRRDDDDEESSSFRRKMRRDNNDDDDDDDRSSRSRRSSRRDDDYDDDDRGRPKKKSRRDEGRTTRAQWEWARKGISFINYGYWCQLGSFAGIILVFLIAWMGGHETILLKIACLPGLVGFILAGVGIGFIVAGPRRGNLLGFSIALAATAGVHLLMMLASAFADKSSLGYGASGFSWLVMPTSYLLFIVMVTSKYGDALIICLGLVEIARYILLMLYLKELGKACKEKEATNRCTMLLIALPSAVAGSIFVALLGNELLKEASSVTLSRILGLLFLIAKLGAYAFIYLLTIKTANEIADATYNAPSRPIVE